MEECQQSASHSGCFNLDLQYPPDRMLYEIQRISKNGNEKKNFAPFRNWMPVTASNVTDSWKSYLFLFIVISWCCTNYHGYVAISNTEVYSNMTVISKGVTEGWRHSTYSKIYLKKPPQIQLCQHTELQLKFEHSTTKN